MLQTEIREKPTAEDYARLQKDVFVFRPPVAVGVEQRIGREKTLARHEDEGEKDERREQRVEQQHGDDGVILQTVFLENIIEAEQCGRKKC